MSTTARLTALTLVFLLGTSAVRAEKDPLDDVKARLKVQAERLEKEFSSERAAAYKLVRSDTPKLAEATEKLESLLAMVRNDTALTPTRREVLIVTLKWDLDKVKELAAERRIAGATRTVGAINRIVRDEARRESDVRRSDSGSKRPSDDARSIIESRRAALEGARNDRLTRNDRFNRVMASVDKSALPEARDYTFPPNWRELTKKRSTTVKMTEKERAIMKALNTVIDADFKKNTFQDVLDYLRRKSGVDIHVEKRALEEAGASYESEISLDAKATLRSVLKRVLGDLNLAYVIKDESIHVTTRERAAQMTTTRTYYVGDVISLVDFRLPFELTQLMMLENARNIMVNITQTVDPQSWKVNNPDAPGTIVFEPITMSFVIKQTAEFHFKYGNYR